MRTKIPLPKALLWLLLSTSIVSGGSFFALHHAKKTHTIGILIQTGPEREALKTAYLIELLGLAHDKPVRLTLNQAREKLLKSPVIKSGNIRVASPHTLMIDYTARRPIAHLHDVKNGALDEEGYLFPLSPFFSPKNLPEIYLGLKKTSPWNIQLKEKRLRLALDILKMCQEAPFSELMIKRIDVEKADEKSLGRREIVLIVGEGESLHFVRLTPKNAREELARYLDLRKKINSPEPQVVDLRVAQLAFLQGCECL